jgi:hypothetical protein
MIRLRIKNWRDWRGARELGAAAAIEQARADAELERKYDERVRGSAKHQRAMAAIWGTPSPRTALGPIPEYLRRQAR